MFSKIWWSVRFAVSLHFKSSETSVCSQSPLVQSRWPWILKYMQLGSWVAIGLLYCTHEMR
jgi:hypothetical protein